MTNLSESPKFHRLLVDEEVIAFQDDVFATALAERPTEVNSNTDAVRAFVNRGISMIQEFEKAALPHPQIHTDTDVVYIDSGPGPYDYAMLTDGKKELEDIGYHKFPWSRQMDRARTRVAYQLVAMITAARIQEETDREVLPRDLTEQDFEAYSPYLMYASTDWQNAHIRHVQGLLKKSGLFKIPDNKLVMYDDFIDRQGERRKIVHTEDQVEGFQFPLRSDGSPPRRVAIVSHPAHLVRILHILGKYPESIPDGTVLQPFPIPTPTRHNGAREYAKAELLGTLATVFKKGRATLVPYKNYHL